MAGLVQHIGQVWPEGKGHTQAAKYLRDKHGLSDWWAQAVTIRYEWERGLRRKESR